MSKRLSQNVKDFAMATAVQELEKNVRDYARENPYGTLEETVIDGKDLKVVPVGQKEWSLKEDTTPETYEKLMRDFETNVREVGNNVFYMLTKQQFIDAYPLPAKFVSDTLKEDLADCTEKVKRYVYSRMQVFNFSGGAGHEDGVAVCIPETFPKGLDEKAEWFDYSDFRTCIQTEWKPSEDDEIATEAELAEAIGLGDSTKLQYFDNEVALNPTTSIEIEDEPEDEVTADPEKEREEQQIVYDIKHGVTAKDIMRRQSISAGQLQSIKIRHGIANVSKALKDRVAHITGDQDALAELLDDYKNTKMPLRELYLKYDLYKNGLYYILDLHNVPRRN
jgi:hypothetical protein